MMRSKLSVLAASMGAIGATGFGLSKYNNFSPRFNMVSRAEELPTYTREEVAKHASKEDRIWVTYNGKVYDVTDFADHHPGGADKIMMAAGGSVDPFWAVFPIHKERPAVAKELENRLVGQLSQEDVASDEAEDDDTVDPFADDPPRHPALGPIHGEKPYNAESPTSLLPLSFTTPNDLWYVRNHMEVPVLDAQTFKVYLTDETQDVENPISLQNLTVGELKSRYENVELTTTIQCAGNRRGQYNQLGQTQGSPWNVGAISTAKWGGVRLCDVLADAGVTAPADVDQLHVQLLGVDGFGMSIPLRKALDPTQNVLLSWEMNGETMPRDHGYPLRVVVPGDFGAKNVKWLGTIRISREEADSPWQRGVAYKMFPPHVKSFKGVDASALPTVQDLPVNSAICVVGENNGTVNAEDGKFSVAGWAYSGGGRAVVRVELSVDEGQTWHSATFTEESEAAVTGPKTYTWKLWTAEIPLPEGTKAGSTMSVICKATDNSYQTQPESLKGIWNLRGILNNSWHRVCVTTV